MPARKVHHSHDGMRLIIHHMRHFDFFEAFPDPLLEQLAMYSEVVLHPPGYKVLKQGTTNKKLHFLIEGELGVYNDGELVIALDRPGEVIGEVSAITGERCNASVVTEMLTEMLVLDAEPLFTESDSYGAQRFINALYVKYAEILSKKLDSTNDRARMFELTNERLEEAKRQLMRSNEELEKKVKARTADLNAQKELLEQQNTVLLANQEQLTELYQNKNLTLEKLSELYEQNLRPLKETLQKFEAMSGTEEDLVGKAQSEVTGLMDLLSPIASLHSTEKALRTKKVLLAENDKKMQRIAQLALGGTGVSLVNVTDVESGKQHIDGGEYDVFCVNSEMLELTNYVKEKNPNTKIVFLGTEDIPTYLKRLKEYPSIENIVLRNPQDRHFTVKNILTTVRKLLSSERFGLDKYMFWGTDVKARKVTGSEQRRLLNDKMVEDLGHMGVRSRLIDDVRAVTEELLMNAVYDAPVDKNGKSLYNHLPRTEKIELAPEHYSTLRYACDGILVGVSVEDPFGAFSKQTILNYLEHCYAGNEWELDKNTGGGGKGLHILIETADLVVFNVEPGKRTEAIALFHVDHKSKKHHTAPSFQFFSTEK